MTDTSQTITNLLSGQIPDYVQEFYPMFVIFVTKYFEFLETSSDSVQTSLQNIRLNRDIDTTANDLAIQFLNTYVPDLPNNAVLDRSILVKHFRNFYETKGSEKSFKFFFKAFFNDDIQIVYPRDYMFATSDGSWYIEKTLRVVGNPTGLTNTTITGASSTATANVSDIIQLNGAGGDNWYDLVLENISPLKTFTSGELITGVSYDYVNNTSSNIAVTSVGTVRSATGRYLNTYSHLSNDQVLQDSEYYQQFSYVIRSRYDRETWADHVLNQLHPSGSILFNEVDEDTISQTQTTSFVKTNVVSTTVKFPNVKNYLTQPTFTFDRTADYQTGTSATTTAGVVVYDASFDYPGENITWALQRSGDSSSITEIARQDGATFDKLQRAVSLDPQLIAWPVDVNSSLVVTRYVAVSSVIATNTTLTSLTKTLTANQTSMLVMITWMKNTTGNNANGESANTLIMTFSSNVTIVPEFDDETQLKYRRIALGRSLEYNELNYVHSSNSIVAANVTSNVALSSTISTAQLTFKPYNWERGLTYDRLSIRLRIDQDQQLTTSLSQEFSTTNITSNGLIAYWGDTSVASIASTSTFTSVGVAYYAFTSNCFVFAGNPASRFIETRNFFSSQVTTLTLNYVVGDDFNGGVSPAVGENLVLQYAYGGSSSWTTAATIWSGGSTWTAGTVIANGGIWVQSGSTTINGVGTLFLTDFLVGQRFTLNTSAGTTAYTIVSIADNRTMTISPALTTSLLYTATPVAQPGTVSTVAGNNQVSGTGTVFTSTYTVGDDFTINGFANTTTAYTITAILSDTAIRVTPTPVATLNNVNFYKITGIPYFYKIPIANQFQTTSITIGTSGTVLTSIAVKLLQTGSPASTKESYAVDSLTFDAFRFQGTSGAVSFRVRSSGAFNINDTDFLNITTIGVD